MQKNIKNNNLVKYKFEDLTWIKICLLTLILILNLTQLYTNKLFN